MTLSACTARPLILLAAALGGARALSVDGEINAARYYEVLAKSQAGLSLDHATMLKQLKEKEHTMYQLANDMRSYDPKKQVAAIRDWVLKTGPHLGLPDGHGPVHETMEAARQILGMEQDTGGKEPHPWAEAKILMPMAAEFLTHVIKAHKRRLRDSKEEL